MNISMLSAFALYFTALIAVGVYFYNKAKSATSFMIGDRSVNYFVTAVATQASDMGAWLFIGYPALVYTNGVFEFWTAIGLIVFTFINWQFIAPKLRSLSEKTNSLTISALFENHFGFSSSTFRILSSVITLLFFTIYISAGLVGLGRLFEAAFNIQYQYGIVLALLGGIMYTLIGGFLAIAWCDLFQGLFLLAVIILVPGYALYTLGTTHGIIEIAQQNNIPLSLLTSPKDTINALLLALGWGLGYFGQLHILTNYMGIKDANNIKYAKYVGMTWQILVLSAATSIGLIGLSFFDYPVANPEMVFINMTTTLFPPFFAGLALCGVIAATLSSMDSQILIAGSVISEDLFKKQWSIKTNPVAVSRLASICISVLALMIAWNATESIYFLVNYAWAGMGSAFGPLIITCLYGKRITSSSAIAGIVSGALISAFWPLLHTGILPLVPGFFGSLIMIHTISIFGKK